MTIPFEESSYMYCTRKVFSILYDFYIEIGIVLVFIERGTVLVFIEGSQIDACEPQHGTNLFLYL